MPNYEDLTTYTYPGDPGFTVGFSGGGACPPWWTPTVAGSAGTSLEVHGLGLRGNLRYAGSYNLVQTALGVPVVQGIAALVRVGGSFVGDAEGAIEKDPAEPIRGYIAYARGGNITIGRGGDNVPHSNGNYVVDYEIQTETLNQNNAFAWCLVAGAHYWAVNFYDDVGFTPQEFQNGYLLDAIMQYLQIIAGRPIDPTPPTGYNAIT